MSDTATIERTVEYMIEMKNWSTSEWMPTTWDIPSVGTPYSIIGEKGAFVNPGFDRADGHGARMVLTGIRNLYKDVSERFRPEYRLVRKLVIVSVVEEV